MSGGGRWRRLGGQRQRRGAGGHAARTAGTGRAVPNRELPLATALRVQDVYLPHLLLTNFVVVVLQRARDTSLQYPSKLVQR
jgi:hypothetical protein